MRRVYFMCMDAAIAALVLVPFFLFLSRKFLHSRRKAMGYAALAVYLCAMFAVVGLPDVCYVRLDPHFNFQPFAYMFSDFTNSFLNVVLFVPMGFFLPLFWKPFARMWKTALFGLGLSLFVEILQIFTLRATDINDLMTNTFGCLLGWCLGRTALRLVPGICPEENTHWLWNTCISAFGCMFFLHPFMESAVWFFIDKLTGGIFL